MTKTEDGGLI